MSNLYTLKHGTLQMNPKRGFGDVPLVKLGDETFKKVKVRLSGAPRRQAIHQRPTKWSILTPVRPWSDTQTYLEPFMLAQDFLSRFETIPDILELDHLTVSGNVRFGKNVVLRVRAGE